VTQEALRRKYRPEKVRLLLIGEAPPASGRFFYQQDSGLYRAIREAFLAIEPSITDESFLSVFQESGCYLIDLCPRPVDHLDARSRRAACVANEASLCKTIGSLQPRAIVTLLRSIRGNVARAVSCAGWQGSLLELPYPGRWRRHREIFVDALVPQLKAIGMEAGRKASRSACVDQA
jgi:hypothetical protein